MAWTASALSRLLTEPSGFPETLSEETTAAMLAAGSVRSFEKNEFITRRGQDEPLFCIVLKGHVRLTAFTSEGRETLSIFVREGEVWGLHPCLGGFRETNDSVAEERTEILLLRGKPLQDLMWKHRDLQNAVIAILCSRLNLALKIAEQFGTWSARERVIWRILLLACGHAGDFDRLRTHVIDISQESLAAMVRLSRQRVNMLLGELQAEGAIDVKYGQIHICDADILRRGIEAVR